MIELNIKRIYLWSFYLRLIVIITTIFFIFTLGYFFCLRPKLEMRENHYLNLLALEKELNAQLKIASGYSSYRRKIENLKNKFDMHINNRVDKFISPILSDQLIAPFFDINKINILSIKNKNFLNSLQVKSNLSSTNNNIINFLHAMIRLEKFIFIENFRWNILNNLSTSQKQNIVFLFKIYTLKFSRENLILALPKIIKLDAKSELERDNLIKFPLNKIKMIGYYSDNKTKNFGFVLLPNKQIFKVQIGEQLGLERDLVIGIYDQQLLILNENLNKIIKLSIENRK
jgi:Tfp pilus assembly protein PilO